MSHGMHRARSGRGGRAVMCLLSLVTIGGLAVGLSGPASAVSTTQLQYDLAGLAYLPWSGIDGQTGPQTSAATRAFQSDACIAVDGIDGPQTDAALAAKVTQVQAVAGAARDGAFGPNTRAAVASWQGAHGLTADGQAGPNTMAAMGIARTGCSGPPPPPPPPPGALRGMDVSGYQGNVDWAAAYGNGARFAYIKATEGTTYASASFGQQYNGSYSAGLIRGAYHFALPNRSSGTAQADFFASRGGGWSADGKTLPPALDIEYNPYSGNTCYDLSQSAMVNWIAAFSNEMRARTSRYPVIYTTTDWWVTCTGNSPAFAATNPLWVARYSSSAGALPAGWGSYTFWQNANAGSFPGDQDQFNGDLAALQSLAYG